MEKTIDWAPQELSGWREPTEAPREDDRLLTFPLPSRHEEAALFGVSASAGADEWEDKKTQILPELRILAGYLHSHVLRTNGHDANREILVSARDSIASNGPRQGNPRGKQA